VKRANNIFENVKLLNPAFIWRLLNMFPRSGKFSVHVPTRVLISEIWGREGGMQLLRGRGKLRGEELITRIRILGKSIESADFP